MKTDGPNLTNQSFSKTVFGEDKIRKHILAEMEEKAVKANSQF